MTWRSPTLAWMISSTLQQFKSLPFLTDQDAECRVLHFIPRQGIQSTQAHCRQIHVRLNLPLEI